MPERITLVGICTLDAGDGSWWAASSPSQQCLECGECEPEFFVPLKESASGEEAGEGWPSEVVIQRHPRVEDEHPFRDAWRYVILDGGWRRGRG